jgi:hypothetical protein
MTSDNTSNRIITEVPYFEFHLILSKSLRSICKGPLSKVALNMIFTDLYVYDKAV